MFGGALGSVKPRPEIESSMAKETGKTREGRCWDESLESCLKHAKLQSSNVRNVGSSRATSRRGGRGDAIRDTLAILR
jgi:hypothetical protein